MLTENCVTLQPYFIPIFMAEKILITGAGGFIGGYIVEESLRRGYDTYAGVRNTTSREYLTDTRITFINLDFAHPDKLQSQLLQYKKEMGGWDYIIHNLGVTKCKKSKDFYTINYEYTRNFANALVACGMTPKKFIYMSSLSVCGKGDEVNHTPIKLTDTPHPNTHYGKSKLKAEECLHSLPDFPYIILRPTGVYGPREKDYLIMMQSIKWGIDLRAGYSKQLITFIYIKDLIRGVFAAVEGTTVRKKYFLSEEQAYSSSGFGNYVARELGKKFVVPIILPMWLLWLITHTVEGINKLTGWTSAVNRDKYHIMSQRNWVCDTSSTREDLDFVPQYSLEQGVRETVAWYRDNKWL